MLAGKLPATQPPHRALLPMPLRGRRVVAACQPAEVTKRGRFCPSGLPTLPVRQAVGVVRVARLYWMRTVLGGELAVPCTRNPL